MLQLFLSVFQVCGPPGMMNHVSGEKDKREQGEVIFLTSIHPLLASNNRQHFFFFFNSVFRWVQLSGVLKEVGYTENMVYKF